MSDNLSAATHEELCNDALAHYDKISVAAGNWLSTVPQAIEFYKQHGGGNDLKPKLHTCSKGHTGEPYIGTDGFPRCKECRREYDRAYKLKNSSYHARNRELKRFSGLRESVIQRDGERCVDCGMTRDEHKERFGRDITVNHIDGQGRYSDKHNSTLGNMETLCLPCHSRKDNLRRNAQKEVNNE